MRAVGPVFLLVLASTGTLGSVVLSGGCAKDPVYATRADAGTGGATGTGGNSTSMGGTTGATGGAAGRGDYMSPACNPSSSTLGKIMIASPLISVGKPVKASSGILFPEKVVDGLYPHSGLWLPAAMLPGWVAIEVGTGPGRLLLSWADAGWNDYNTPVPGGSPSAYTIATSGDSTDGSDGAWETVVTVPNNAVRERAHTFAFSGKKWVKLLVTAAANAAAPTSQGVSIDEIALHDITQSPTTVPPDTWFFMGDSITVNAFRRQFGAGTSFDAIIHANRPAYAPNMLDGGIGGELSAMGLSHLANWLALNPDVQHIPLLYGTNDSWGDGTPPSPAFETNMKAMVQMVLDAGRVPILARIPYSAQAPTMLPKFNSVIDAISTEKRLPCGPDLYAWFRDHPEEVSSDGVHPNAIGYQSMNRLWAQAMLGLYPPN